MFFVKSRTCASRVRGLIQTAVKQKYQAHIKEKAT